MSGAAADTASWRRVQVAVERLAGWLDRFEQRHGDLRWSLDGGAAVVQAPDGAVARLELAVPVPAPGRAVLLDTAAEVTEFGLVLVRRHGYAVGRVRDGVLSATRCGTRYVQGRTSAGGWSQQRYARRRANQADALVEDAATAVRDLLTGAPLVVRGGDRQLVARVLAAAGPTAEAPVSPRWLDVPDPRRRVLDDTVAAARAAEIRLNERA